MMLQFAFFLGVKEVYILGLDYNYGKLNKFFKPGKIKITKENYNLVKECHFDENYYKIGDHMGVPNLEDQKKAFQISEELRELNPKIRIQLNMGGGSFKSQLKRADKSNSNYAIIIGLDELKNDYLSLKSLRRNQEQVKIPFSKINELTNIIFD